MSNKDKFFTKVKIGEIPGKITAVDISKKFLVVGTFNGDIYSYEISDKLKERKNTSIPSKAKIDKILIPPNNSFAFILSGGDIYLTQIPNLNIKQEPLNKDKKILDIYLNIDDPEYSNHLLVITKKKKIKIYEFDSNQQKLVGQKKNKKELLVENIPTCGVWTEKNNFIYSIGDKTYWVDINQGKVNLDDFEKTVQIINLDGKIAVSNHDMTLFMKDGGTCQFNPITHVALNGIEFKGFATFKTHLIALYKNALLVFKKGEQQYDLVESLEFGGDGSGRFLLTSDYKIIAITESIGKFNVLDFQERPYEEQIKVLLDQKLFNNGLEKLIENVPEDEPDKFKKIESYFLDCAWACIEGAKKDYDNAVKYLSLTDFNPFEFMYMFYETLSINIIHSDKKQAIIDNRKENQLLGLTYQPEEAKKAYSFLIKILIMKRNYILNKFKNSSAEYEKQKITFMSSKRGKINLSDLQDVTIRETYDSMNSALIKSMIKLDNNPKDIESVLDNESFSYSIFTEFEKDPFFLDEKNKNLEDTKFTLAYISEKLGDYETALKEWENFGNNKPVGDKFAIIGKERTKKIFYKFKENKSTDRDLKERLLRQYIPWLLKKYPKDAFEVILKTELISSKVFMEEIIPEVEKSDNETNKGIGNLKEQFLEYCNENQQSEIYQTQLLKLYADKLFEIKKKDDNVVELTKDMLKYHEPMMKIIQNPKSCFNKRAVLEHIEHSWLREPIKNLYSQLNEHNKALDELFKNARAKLKFDEIEKYCEENIKLKPDIFQTFYKLLSDVVNKDCQGNIDKNEEEIKNIKQKIEESRLDKYITDTEKEKDKKKLEDLNTQIKQLEELKKPYEAEMLKILKKYGNIKNLDPVFALNYANDYWNICDNNDFFTYLSNIVREFTVEGNKYKIGKNLSEMGLVYKEKEAYEYKKKYVLIDGDKTCDLCKKKIGNTIFVVYPNLKVYHSKCAGNNYSIDPMTGVDFSKKKYIE